MPSITITWPPPTLWVGKALDQITLCGTSSTGTVGRLRWENPRAGVSGYRAAATNWTCTIPLAQGTNTLSVTGTNRLGDAHTRTVTVRQLAQGCSGTIVISELHINPAAAPDATAEWIELYNTSRHPVDVAGWTLRDLGTENHEIDSAKPRLVPPRGFFVIGHCTDPAQNGNVAVDYDCSLSLANTEDEIVIEDTGGVEQGRVEYSVAGGWTVPSGKSIHLRSPDLDPNDPAAWAVSTRPWAGSAGDCGTPGAANGTGTWGPSGTVIRFR
jgi:hypothetical protein